MTKRRRPVAAPPQAQSLDWLQQLNRISDTVDAWHERTKNPVSPEDGSSLAADAMDGLSVEPIVWYSMCVSVEHLKFTLNAMRATHTMYPTAYMTVARTAHVAAVNAVWLLAPKTRQERRERAIRIKADDIRVEIVGLNAMQLSDLPHDAAREDILRQLAERQKTLQDAATAIGLAEDVKKMRFTETDAINWVAGQIHGAGSDLLIASAQYAWRSGSAAAHGQYHFGIMRRGQSEVVRDVSGGQIVRLRGDLENDVGPALAAAALTLQEAFRLYDLRRVMHR